MFTKKDLRKIPTILDEAIECTATENDDDDAMLVDVTDAKNSSSSKNDNKDNNIHRKRLKVEKPLSELRLGRRQQEFQGKVTVLCQPMYMSKLQSLQILNVYDCGISNVNGIGMFKDCHHLTTINMGRNPITELPTEFGLLKSLKELWLDDCQLRGSLPLCLMELSQLEILKISNNHITHLPTTMVKKMIHLRVLNLDGNPLVGSNSGGGSGTGTSKILNEEEKDQEEEKEENMMMMKDDDTEVHRLPPFPNDWSGMKSLEELYMRNCQMTQLPHRLPPSLLCWHISSNPLSTLQDQYPKSNKTNNPDESDDDDDNEIHPSHSQSHQDDQKRTVWHNLPRLKDLSLNSCQLTSLPYGLVSGLLLPTSSSSSSSSLTRLMLSHNPNLKQLPLEVLHVIRASTEFQTGPNIIWEPNPQLESQIISSSQ